MWRSAICRRNSLHSGHVLRSLPCSEKSYVSSVVNFIQDVVPQAVSSGARMEEKERVLWVKFDHADINDLELLSEMHLTGSYIPLVLIIGYAGGYQIYAIHANGEAHEVVSVRHGPVSHVKMISTPRSSDTPDEFSKKRPIVATCDCTGGGPPYSTLVFSSMATGETLVQKSFMTEVRLVLCNPRVVVVGLSSKVAVLDNCNLGVMFMVTSCYQSPDYCCPVALGDRWLAFADRKLSLTMQSSGGVSNLSSQSYTSTVITAAKKITQGLSGFVTPGPRIAGFENQPSKTAGSCPGVVSVLDVHGVRQKEVNIEQEDAMSGLVAHFRAYDSIPLSALNFSPNGSLLLAADTLGHVFHLFRLMLHPLSSSMSSVHHLYTLRRGDTDAMVQQTAFSLDSRWVAVTTCRGTTHIFPITPYGGPVNKRTHATPRVVNRISRFQTSAGIEELMLQRSNSLAGSVALGCVPSTNTSSPKSSPSASAMSSSASAITASSEQPAGFVGHHLSSARSLVHCDTHIVLPGYQVKMQPASVLTGGFSVGAAQGLRIRPDSFPVGVTFGPQRGLSGSSPKQSRRSPSDYYSSKLDPDSLYIMSALGDLVQYRLSVQSCRGGVVADDSPFEVAVNPVAQWSLLRSHSWPDVQLGPEPYLPFMVAMQIAQSKGLLILPGLCDTSSEKIRSGDLDETGEEAEDWLAQVEIVTHCPPHRRLWMGPQFSFRMLESHVMHNQLSPVILDRSPPASFEDRCWTSLPSVNPVSFVVTQPMPFKPAMAHRESTSVVIEASTSLKDLYGSYNSELAAVFDLEDRVVETIAEAMVEHPFQDLDNNGGAVRQRNSTVTGRGSQTSLTSELSLSDMSLGGAEGCLPPQRGSKSPSFLFPGDTLAD